MNLLNKGIEIDYEVEGTVISKAWIKEVNLNKISYNIWNETATRFNQEEILKILVENCYDRTDKFQIVIEKGYDVEYISGVYFLGNILKQIIGGKV